MGVTIMMDVTKADVENLSQEWLDKRNLKGAFKNYD